MATRGALEEIRKVPGKHKSRSVTCEGCQRQKSFAILICHLVCLTCGLKWFSFPKDILSCNCRFPFSVLVLSHSALDNQFKIFPQAVFKMSWRSWWRIYGMAHVNMSNFFLPVMGVVMAKQLLAQLDQQLQMVGLGDILPLIELLYKLY